MSDPFMGEIRMFAGTFAPRGWAFCNGQLLAISSNSALFALLGTNYGGDGMTTFGLPDLRGRVPTGTGQGVNTTNVTLGQISGSPTTTLVTSQLPIHTPTATFTGAVTSAVTVAVGTTSANPVVEPTAGVATYLTAATAASGRTPVSINGLFTDTAPTSPATLGGITATATVTGTVTVAPVGGSQAVPIAQPYLGVSFIIALEGIFPSRN